MSRTFTEQALDRLAQFKAIIRRATDKAERDQLLEGLGLNYQYANDNACQLYRKLQQVALYFHENMLHRDLEKTYQYSGYDNFYRDLQAFMSEYHIENDGLIHSRQLASKAMIEVIQLATLNVKKLCSADVMRRLAHANGVIAAYGTREQHQHHIENLRKYGSEDNSTFFEGMINNFNKVLHELSSSHKQQVET